MTAASKYFLVVSCTGIQESVLAKVKPVGMSAEMPPNQKKKSNS